jgi:hypothetical protein
MRTPIALLLPLAALTLALTACGGGTPVPAADEPTPATATPHPTPTEAADEDVPVAIQISTSEVDIVGRSGETVGLVAYADPAADAVATFTEAFGFAPVITDRPGGVESAPSRVYDWSGFTVIDGEGLTIMNSDIVVDVSVASVGDIEILSVPGLHVGDSFDSVFSIADTDLGFPGQLGVDTRPVDPASVGEAPGSPLNVFVAVYGTSSGPITHFTAPTPNWGV